MATEQSTAALHGGRLVAKRLKAHGVTKLFTLSGGHLFSIYDGCREEGIALVDVRHEQTAAFAAEGWAKATRRLLTLPFCGFVERPTIALKGKTETVRLYAPLDAAATAVSA